MENKANKTMNIKNQVLSIEQVQELQELGFDVRKHASLYFVEEKYFVKENFIVLPEQIDITRVPEDVKITPTMTIGDIIEVLPEKIIEKFYGGNVISFMEINKKSVCYSCYHKCSESDIMAFISTQENLIDRLFDCLVWCIQEKHIKL